MINPVSKKYAVTVALNDEETEKDLQKLNFLQLGRKFFISKR